MIRLIAAIDRKKGIAKDGFQPWSIPADEAYFAEQTNAHGGNVLMGSITYKKIGKPLPNRNNYVLTTDKTPIEGVELVFHLDKFLNDFQNQDVWVIGGANLFAQVMQMNKADELYLTKIEADFGCNQFFPDYEDKYVKREQSALHEQNGFVYTFEVYTRAGQ